MKLLLLISIFALTVFPSTYATKYGEWSDIPDCAVYCIKYTGGHNDLNCADVDPECYCNKPKWPQYVHDCIYQNDLAGCKDTVQSKDKQNLINYINNVFCPTLNGTKLESSAASSNVHVASATDDNHSVNMSATSVRDGTDSQQTSSSSTSMIIRTLTAQSTITSSSQSGSTSSSSSDATASTSGDDWSYASSDDSSTSTSTSTSTSPPSTSTDSTSASTDTSTSTSDTSDSSSSSTDSTSTETTTISLTSTSSLSTSNFSSVSYSVTTTVVMVTASIDTTTHSTTSTTTTGGFLQDPSTATAGAPPRSNVLSYDGGMECILCVESMMALLMLLVGMVLLVT